MILVYITCPDGDEAWKIGHELVEEKLAASIATFSVRSMHWRKGDMREKGEYVLLVQTQSRLFEEMKNKVKEIHSYDVPDIIRLEASASTEYSHWMEKVLTS